MAMHSDRDLYLLIGTYTKKRGEGIHVCRFDTRSGRIEPVGITPVKNPSYLTACNGGISVYSVTENEKEPCYSHALEFDPQTGVLTLLNSHPTDGAAPCHINTDHSDRFVVTANYGSGSLNVFRVHENRALGSLLQSLTFRGESVHPERQQEPHLHCVRFSPDGRFLFVTDLGTDTIYRFEMEPENEERPLRTGSRTDFEVAAGSGPRHLVFHPSGNYLYLINELSGTVMAFGYNGGELKHLQTAAADFHRGESGGDIAVTPDGRFLYASVREKHDGVAIFSIDPKSGKLTRTGYQNTVLHPRSIAVTPDGRFLLVAGMKSNRVEVYAIAPDTGTLIRQHQSLEIPRPVCLQFIPSAAAQR